MINLTVLDRLARWWLNRHTLNEYETDFESLQRVLTSIVDLDNDDAELACLGLLALPEKEDRLLLRYWDDDGNRQTFDGWVGGRYWNIIVGQEADIVGAVVGVSCHPYRFGPQKLG